MSKRRESTGETEGEKRAMGKGRRKKGMVKENSKDFMMNSVIEPQPHWP